jgi:glycosyltransferase involved in cell wall biosynthesis
LTGRGGKVRVIGQGIDVNRFTIQDSRFTNADEKFKIVTVGRITPSKDYDTFIEAILGVREKYWQKIVVDIIGPTTVASDETYLNHLKEKIAEKGLVGIISFLGPIANNNLPETLSRYHLFVNMGHTGSMDKAVPEAMAVGLPILTCNEAFYEVLGPFRGDLMYPKGDAEALSGKVLEVIGLSEEERKKLGQELRAIVVRDHSLNSFVHKIILFIQYELSNRYESTNKKQW